MGTALIAAAAASGHDVVSIDVSPAGPARPGASRRTSRLDGS